MSSETPHTVDTSAMPPGLEETPQQVQGGEAPRDGEDGGFFGWFRGGKSDKPNYKKLAASLSHKKWREDPTSLFLHILSLPEEKHILWDTFRTQPPKQAASS